MNVRATGTVHSERIQRRAKLEADIGAAPSFWGEIAVKLLHPIQLLIIEALCHIDQPLSPTLLLGLYGNETPLGTWDYHCRRLTALGVLQLIEKVQVRGATENFYDLALEAST